MAVPCCEAFSLVGVLRLNRSLVMIHVLDRKHVIRVGTTLLYVIRRDGEYQVRVREDGKLNADRTYFTTDHEDALDTLPVMAEEERKHQLLTERKGLL